MGNRMSMEEFNKMYTLEDGKLGDGAFAVVKKCVHKDTGRTFAAKIIKKNRLGDREKSVVHDEITIMRQLDHAHVVKLFDVYETEKTLILVMELMYGDLMDYFQRDENGSPFTEEEAAIITSRIAEALVYLQSKGITHRDLKPENLLCYNPDDKTDIKLGDFGTAKHVEQKDAKMHSACGSPSYVAPEILLLKPYGPEVDIWSLGIVIYRLLSGLLPFDGRGNRQLLYQSILEGKFTFPEQYFSHITKDQPGDEGGRDLVKRCLVLNPKGRIKPEKVLQHPWIRKYYRPIVRGPPAAPLPKPDKADPISYSAAELLTGVRRSREENLTSREVSTRFGLLSPEKFPDLLMPTQYVTHGFLYESPKQRKVVKGSKKPMPMSPAKTTFRTRADSVSGLWKPAVTHRRSASLSNVKPAVSHRRSASLRSNKSESSPESVHDESRRMHLSRRMSHTNPKLDESVKAPDDLHTRSQSASRLSGGSSGNNSPRMTRAKIQKAAIAAAMKLADLTDERGGDTDYQHRDARGMAENSLPHSSSEGQGVERGSLTRVSTTPRGASSSRAIGSQRPSGTVSAPSTPVLSSTAPAYSFTSSAAQPYSSAPMLSLSQPASTNSIASISSDSSAVTPSSPVTSLLNRDKMAQSDHGLNRLTIIIADEELTGRSHFAEQAKEAGKENEKEGLEEFPASKTDITATRT